jgi:transposase
MKRQRREYTEEFKHDAVLLSFENGKTIDQTAKNLGIHHGLLGRWRREYKADRRNAFRGNGKLKAEAEELRQLKKEVSDLKMEREILKKALAIFSKTQR